jgi:hypothetical protein
MRTQKTQAFDLTAQKKYQKNTGFTYENENQTRNNKNRLTMSREKSAWVEMLQQTLETDGGTNTVSRFTWIRPAPHEQNRCNEKREPTSVPDWPVGTRALWRRPKNRTANPLLRSRRYQELESYRVGELKAGKITR